MRASKAFETEYRLSQDRAQSEDIQLSHIPGEIGVVKDLCDKQLRLIVCDVVYAEVADALSNYLPLIPPHHLDPDENRDHINPQEELAQPDCHAR